MNYDLVLNLEWELNRNLRKLDGSNGRKNKKRLKRRGSNNDLRPRGNRRV